jgi:glyoxylase-like metal-dependent hydrolase (beta-lactamase superfamily II)
MIVKAQGQFQPSIYAFNLGSFRVAAILDSKIVRGGLSPSHGGEAMADEVRQLARANRIDADRYEHPFIPSLVDTGNQLVLFDTGNGALAREREPLRGRVPDGHLVERMEQLGYKPDDVDVVVVTHGHPDHIGGLMEGGKPVFPNARYVFGAAEFDFWRRGEVREFRKLNRELFMQLAAPLSDRASLIKPGDEVVPGIRAVDASGHSPGMMAYLIESEGRRVLNWADTCAHFVISLQRPDVHLDVDDDEEKAVATAQTHSRHGGSRGAVRDRLSHAVPRDRVCRANGRRVSLDAARLSVEPLERARGCTITAPMPPQMRDPCTLTPSRVVFARTLQREPPSAKEILTGRDDEAAHRRRCRHK